MFGVERSFVLPTSIAAVLWGLQVSLVVGADSLGATSPKATAFSMAIRVKGMPTAAQRMPVSTPVDLGAALDRLNAGGIINEQSLRLFRLSERSRSEEVFQFTPAEQPRPRERKLLPGTVPGVSYLAEYGAGEEKVKLPFAGELTWFASAEDNGAAEYELEFQVMREGSAIQVPYSPYSVNTFDAQGRAARVRWFPEMQIRPQWPIEGWLHLYGRNELVTSYYLGPKPGQDVSYRRPFFYPVRGLDGVPLTEFGKSHDPTGSHGHHYSLWIAHANVGGKDFWSEKGGVIVHQQLERLEDGPIFCRVAHQTLWLDSSTPVMKERREFKIYAAEASARLIDVDLQFRTPGNEPVTLGKTSFGFLAVRVAQSMSVFDGGGEIMNANGALNEQQAHLQRASWMDQSGPIGPDLWNGIAFLEHPNNPGHPTGWHCRNDGWACAAFNMTEAYTLVPEKLLHLRYRVLLHRGGAGEAQIKNHSGEYSAKTTIELGPLMGKPENK